MSYEFDSKRPIVISLGGSILYPEQIDVDYIKAFNDFIRRHVKKGRRFIIVTGGGRLARNYQVAANAVSKVSDYDADWIGIHATRLNAQLLRTVMEDICNHVVIDTPGKLSRLTKPVTFGSGWRPGRSTDYVSVMLAIDYGAAIMVNAGKPDRVYSDDFVKNAAAKPFDKLSWKEYRALVPREWKPGMSTPVDPVAARLAERHKIKVVVINGKNLENFEKLLEGDEFHGTVIG